jgi:FtsP/CotA-like multicopper oxidase with cupredoxin domain
MVFSLVESLASIIPGRRTGSLTIPINKLNIFYRPLPIDVNSTDSLILHVTNSLDQATSIHHHGMFFNSTTWMDGADGITEWYLDFLVTFSILTPCHSGIPPGGQFDYVVPINSSGQWGTYWAHAHSGVSFQIQDFKHEFKFFDVPRVNTWTDYVPHS